MLEIPFLDEIIMEKTREAARAAAREATHENIAMVLEGRFGDVPRDLVEAIASVVDEKRLKGLVRLAGTCPDLVAFRRAVVPD